MTVSKKRYEEARRKLTPHREEEMAMRIVERGAMEFGAERMRKRWVAELSGKGWKDLARYFGRLLKEKPE